MDLVEVIKRSISGYIFVFPGLLLYFLGLNKIGKRQTKAHTITSFVFCYYLIGILTMTGIGKLGDFSPTIVWFPFIEIRRSLMDIVLNIFLFTPLGVFLSLLYEKYNNINKTILTTFLISLSIESFQMFGRGTTDINDLIANTVGVCLGYVMYKILTILFPREYIKLFNAVEINDYFEVLFCWLYSFLLVLTIQPFIIHLLFRLG